jgi:hypothetical protein
METQFIPLMSTVAQPIDDLPSRSVKSPPREMSKKQFKVMLIEGYMVSYDQSYAVGFRNPSVPQGVTAKAKGSPVPGEDS